MSKPILQWGSALLLSFAVMSTASAEVLLKLVRESEGFPGQYAYRSTRTIDSSDIVTITHKSTPWSGSDSNALISRDKRAAGLTAKRLRGVIAEAATGTVSGLPLAGGETLYYYAYKYQSGTRTEIFLRDLTGAKTNDSPAVAPLVEFIHGLCGDLARAPWPPP